MNDTPEGTSLVVINSPLVERVAQEAKWNCGRPLVGRVEVIAYQRRRAQVVITDRLGNLLINKDSDGWFDDIPFALAVAKYLNENR